MSGSRDYYKYIGEYDLRTCQFKSIVLSTIANIIMFVCLYEESFWWRVHPTLSVIVGVIYVLWLLRYRVLKDECDKSKSIYNCIYRRVNDWAGNFESPSIQSGAYDNFYVTLFSGDIVCIQNGVGGDSYYKVSHFTQNSKVFLRLNGIYGDEVAYDSFEPLYQGHYSVKRQLERKLEADNKRILYITNKYGDKKWKYNSLVSKPSTLRKYICMIFNAMFRFCCVAYALLPVGVMIFLPTNFDPYLY